MKKLLFITPELPYPAQSGGKVKSLKLLHALAERYDVCLACPLKMEDPDHVDAFHGVSPCAEHIHERVDIPRTPRNLLASYGRGVPLNVQRTYSQSLADEIAARAGDYDLIVLDHYEVFRYLPESFSGVVIYHAHNAYFKMWQRYAQLPGNPVMRAAAWLESVRVRRYEARVARSVDLTFAAPNDAAELVAASVDADTIRNTYHLGDDSQLERPDLRFDESAKKLMYVGFLGWEPNSQGLIWFIENVWPHVRQAHPDVTFDIVGKNASEELSALVDAHPGIKLLGFVPDLQDVYSSSRVSVAPLLFGSGMKVKVLDALAAGLPTVTTSVGAEGIAIEPDTHLLVADEPEEMAQQILRLLTDETLWECLQKNSRKLVAAKYTWKALFDAMHADIDCCVQARGVNPRTPAHAF